MGKRGAVAALAWGIVGTPSIAAAQPTGFPAEDVVVVTGTAIADDRSGAALPVDVLDNDMLRTLGSPSPVELFKGLPSASGLLGDANQFDTRTQFTEGQANANLRGLGPQRTLVLLDSGRLAPGQAEFVGVDINIIPWAALDRIEVLKDGGAVVYGSDALAGVVNFITRRDQDGLRFSASTRFVDGVDNDADFSASYGFARGPWSGLLAAGYQFRSELLARDRSFTLLPYEDNPGGGFTGGGNPGNFVPYGRDAGGAPEALAGLTPDADCEAVGGVVPDRCRTRFVPFDSLREKQHRRQLYGRLARTFSDAITLETTALYGRTDVPHYRSSASLIPIQGASNNPLAGIAPGFFVPSDNPGLVQYMAENTGTEDALPPGTEFVVLPPLVWRPFLSGGNPLFQNDTPENRAEDDLGAQQGRRTAETTRLTARLLGEPPDERLRWEASVLWQRYGRAYGNYDSLVDRLQLALQGLGGPGCDPVTGVPGEGACGWFNPFGNAYAENPALRLTNPGGGVVANDDLDLIRWFFVEARTTIETSLFVAEGTFDWESGVNLPGGAARLSGGVQYRRNGYDAAYSDVINLTQTPCRDTVTTGNTGCAGTPGPLALLTAAEPFSTESDAAAFFIETFWPVTPRLSVSLAGRAELYGSNRSTFDPRLTAQWQALSWLSLRGSASTTFRAPSPQSLDDRAITGSFANVRGSFRPTDIVGNPNLNPETSTNLSAGVSITRGAVSVSVDYWRYDIDDQIVVEPVAGLIDTLFPAEGADRCADPDLADIRTRFTFDGGVCALDSVARVRRQTVNGPELLADGIDASLRYRHPEPVAGGTLSIDASATWNRRYETGDQQIAGTVVEPGFDGAGRLNYQTTAYPIPSVKARGLVSYEHGPVVAGVIGRYTSAYDDARPGILPAFKTIDAALLTDLTVSYALNDKFRFQGAVFNVADRAPSAAQLEYGYDSLTGDPLGRTVRLGIEAKF